MTDPAVSAMSWPREPDPDAGAVAQELRRAGVPVETGTRRRAEYSSDAGNYRVVAGAIAFPRHVDEVQLAVAACHRTGTPLVVRGAGTSIAGNAIGSGLVLDLSRHLHRVRSIDPDAATAVVDPGAVLDTISAAARPYGLTFGPDPSTHSRATIGGSIGNNACGAHAMSAGRTGDQVVELDVVGIDGARFTAGAGSAGPFTEPLRALVGGDLATVRTEFGRFRRQVSGDRKSVV